MSGGEGKATNVNVTVRNTEQISNKGIWSEKKFTKKQKKDRNDNYQDLWEEVTKSKKCGCGPIQVENIRNFPNGTKIVNGEEATPHEFPWIITMQYPDGYWFCGGAILTEDYVVTAAHCVEDMKPSEARIRIGDHDNDDPNDTLYNKKQSLEIQKIIMHSKYDPESFNNDIALLKLATKIDFKKFGGIIMMILD